MTNIMIANDLDHIKVQHIMRDLHYQMTIKHKNMKFFEASFSTIFIRYNLMIGVVVTAFAIGQPFLAILAVPLLLSSMLGIKFQNETMKKRSMSIKQHTIGVTHSRAA